MRAFGMAKITLRGYMSCLSFLLADIRSLLNILPWDVRHCLVIARRAEGRRQVMNLHVKSLLFLEMMWVPRPAFMNISDCMSFRDKWLNVYVCEYNTRDFDHRPEMVFLFCSIHMGRESIRHCSFIDSFYSMSVGKKKPLKQRPLSSNDNLFLKMYLPRGTQTLYLCWWVCLNSNPLNLLTET